MDLSQTPQLQDTLAWIHNSLAVVLFEAGSYAEALDMLDHALKRATRLDDHIQIAVFNFNTAYVYLLMGEWDRSSAWIASGLPTCP